MPKNVMKLLKPSPHRQRNDFDLSHRHVFDANFGELLPATCIETVPGDNITLHASDLLRAIPFVSSPFLRAKQHLDVWFVPYRDLWHQFDAFITQKSEPVSSAFKSSAYCPWFSANALRSSINGGGTDVVGRNVADRSYYLLQLLGYGDIENNYGSSSDTFKFNPFRLAAYNFIWYNEYRQQYYDDGKRLLNTSYMNSPAYLFNFDNLDCSSLNSANVLGASIPGYAELGRAMCQMRYRTWKKDLFTGLLPSTQFGNVSTLSGGSVTGLTAAFTGTPATITTGSDEGRHYHSYDHEAFPTDIFSAPAGGRLAIQTMNIDKSEAQALNGQGDTVAQWQAETAEYGVPDKHLHQASYTPQGSVSLNTNTGSLSFDVLSLRKAEAVQIWRENALRAGNHIKDNMMAHYGVASDFQDHRPTYLGSVSAPLNIGDIATTANSGSGINDTVGDIAGKGLSSLSEKVFKFHAKEFGVIMVMFSMLPEAEYDALGIERTNQLLESEDFFIPEYENLGLEGVSASNFVVNSLGKPSIDFVTGYAPRYFGYKTKLDKCFGAFAGNGIFRTWTSQRTDVTNWYHGLPSPLPASPLGVYYVNPAIYDANFNVGIANSPQFLCDIYFDVDAVRPMSVTGLPFS